MTPSFERLTTSVLSLSSIMNPEAGCPERFSGQIVRSSHGDRNTLREWTRDVGSRVRFPDTFEFTGSMAPARRPAVRAGIPVGLRERMPRIGGHESSAARPGNEPAVSARGGRLPRTFKVTAMTKIDWMYFRKG